MGLNGFDVMKSIMTKNDSWNFLDKKPPVYLASHIKQISHVDHLQKYRSWQEAKNDDFQLDSFVYLGFKSTKN